MPPVWQEAEETPPASAGCNSMNLHHLYHLSLIYKNLCQAYRSPGAGLEDLFHCLDVAGATFFVGLVEPAGARWLKPMSITAFLPNCTSAPRLTTVEYTDHAKP
jgi:hypothetical protein